MIEGAIFERGEFLVGFRGAGVGIGGLRAADPYHVAGVDGVPAEHESIVLVHQQ